MKSIIQTDKSRCFLCGRNSAFEPLDEHHVFFGTANRKNSEKYGLKVYLHHWSCHLNGVHKNARLNRALQSAVQKIAMEHYKWSETDFRRIFGKNYI